MYYIKYGHVDNLLIASSLIYYYCTFLHTLHICISLYAFIMHAYILKRCNNIEVENAQWLKRWEPNHMSKVTARKCQLSWASMPYIPNISM